MIKTIKNFSELVAFSHSIFALPFIFMAMVISANGWFGFYLLTLGVLCAVFARNTAMAFNRLVDIDIDKKNTRTINRPSVDGRISKSAILIFCIFNALAFVACSYFINELAFKVSFFMLFVLCAYSYIKRFSSLAHIFLGFCLALSPIAGSIAVSSDVFAWTLLLSAGVVCWVSGFDLLYSLQDIEVDRKLKLHSIPAKFGKANTLIISRVGHFVAICFWVCFVYKAQLSIVSFVGVGVVALLLIYQHYIIKDNLERIDRAFFTSNGFVSIAFFVFVCIDVFMIDK